MGGDRPYSLYYQHSGKTPLASILLAGLAGIAIGIVLAYAYAYLDAYCPYAKGRALGAVFFGVGLGAATAAVAKVGKVRSLPVVLALVAAAALVSYYFCWAFWIHAAFDRFADGNSAGQLPTLGDLITKPLILFRCVYLFNQIGYWSTTSSANDATTGTFLALIWVIEAAAIFGAAMLVAGSTVRSTMFCEACNRWCAKPVRLRATAAGDVAQARAALEAHDLAYLDRLGPATGRQHFWNIEYEQCDQCSKLHAVTVKSLKNTLNRKGEIKSSKIKPVIVRLLLEPEEVATLRNPSPVNATQIVPPPVSPA
jgi:hypothetical protein